MEAMVPKVKALLAAMLPNMEVKDVNQVQEDWDEFATKVAAELEPLWQHSEDEPQVTQDEEIKIPPKKREREEKDK